MYYQKNMNISLSAVSMRLQGNNTSLAIDNEYYNTSMTTYSEYYNITLATDSTYDFQNIILVLLYSLVFAGGSVGAIILSQKLLKTRCLSVTTTAVINLVAVHSVFLIVIPFRISYYVMGKWIFGTFFCSIASAVLHVHMYTSFCFYVAILIIRFVTFINKKIRVDYCKRLHALVTSTVVWTIVVVLILPAIIHLYKNYENKDNKCFEYQVENYDQDLIKINYIIIIAVILAMASLMTIQIIIIAKVVMKFKSAACSHQEFRAQVKSFLFVLAMLISFLPYHIFRIYYIKKGRQHASLELYFYNEFCSGLTTISCFDSLVILAGVSLSK